MSFITLTAHTEGENVGRQMQRVSYLSLLSFDILPIVYYLYKCEEPIMYFHTG